MKIVKQGWVFEDTVDGHEIIGKLERAGRLCYKTEGKITDTSAGPFLKDKIDRGHHSLIEHHSITVRIWTDRGVTHEIVRHRLASYSQESTRYCNYGNEKFGNEITVVLPVWYYPRPGTVICDIENEQQYQVWLAGCQSDEATYFKLLAMGQKPEQARDNLPNSLKTEIVMTCNIREWRHFFKLRCSKAAHPQMRDLAISMLHGFQAVVPFLFDDIAVSVL